MSPSGGKNRRNRYPACSFNLFFEVFPSMERIEGSFCGGIGSSCCGRLSNPLSPICGEPSSAPLATSCYHRRPDYIALLLPGGGNLSGLPLDCCPSLRHEPRGAHAGSGELSAVYRSRRSPTFCHGKEQGFYGKCNFMSNDVQKRSFMFNIGHLDRF